MHAVIAGKRAAPRYWNRQRGHDRFPAPVSC
ncbi:MAG: hypothetical protein QOH19_596 [Actinomycetota bacterium]|nr:hypothetical protein [Actinomycetota bacterium]